MVVMDKIHEFVRAQMRKLAKALNKLSDGKLTPNHITLISLAGHLLVAAAILSGNYVLAAFLLVGFGLLDALDGAMAKIQNNVSDLGGFYDSVADRVKEIILYIAIGSVLVDEKGSDVVPILIAAIGGSFMVSYLRARGGVAISERKTKLKSSEVNQIFTAGVAGFEIRMTILVVALLFSQLYLGVVVIAVLSWVTVAQRLSLISSGLLKNDKN